jgi:8-oxo-dGTP diphosphatase
MNKFRVAQKILLTNQDGEILIVRFPTNPKIPQSLHGKWDFPGGGLEWGESLKSGLQREITEELGKIDFKLAELFFVWDWIHNDDKNKRTVCILYKAKYLDGPIQLNEEHDKYEWVKVGDLKNFDWHDDDLVAVNKIMEVYETRN